MPTVQVEGLGAVQFPDGMSESEMTRQIQSALAEKNAPPAPLSGAIAGAEAPVPPELQSTPAPHAHKVAALSGAQEPNKAGVLGNIGFEVPEALKGIAKGAIKTAQNLHDMNAPSDPAYSLPGNGLAAGIDTKADNSDQLAGKALETFGENLVPGERAVDMLPSAARAGRVLQSIGVDAIHEPVNLGRTVVPLGRVNELKAAGSRVPTVVNALTKRVQQGPMNYPEARDLYSNLASPSMWEKMTTSPTAKREIANMLGGFRQDIGDAAANVGRGEDYENSLNEYRNAKRARAVLGTVGTAGAVAAAKGAGLGTALHVLGKVTGQ